MKKLITKFFSTTPSVVKKGMAAMLCMCLFWGVGCKKSINSTNIFTVEGTIIAFVHPCQGNGILISVENIKNFGETGEFMHNLDSLINYQNAILVPHFNKYPIDNSDLITTLVPGDKLKFECRIATEADNILFMYDKPCPAIYGPISAPCYIITLFLNYQKQ